MLDIAIVLGTAGSGKSMLVKALADYLSEKDVNFATVNLDPGVLEDTLPYSPDVNVRDYVKVEDVMSELGLGPNGSLIAAMDLLVEHLDALRDDIESLNPDVLLVDTPGQMEVFAYRDTGPLVSKLLFDRLKEARQALIFIFDPFLCSTPTSLFSIILLSESVYWRFQKPIVNVLSKIDIIPEEQVEEILKLAKNPSLAFAEGKKIDSLLIPVLLERDEIFSRELIPVSSVTGEGIMDLYAQLLHAWSRSG